MKKLALKDILCLVLVILLVAAVVTLSVLLARQKKISKQAPTYYDQKCAAFTLENANFSQGQIVFIGDSITDGYRLSDFYADLPLAVYNRGIGGDVTSGVYNRLKTSLYDLAPSKIVLLIGINDINSGRTNDEIIANYTSILDEIKKNLPAADVTCLSVLPMHDKVAAWGIDLEKATAQIKDLNGKIKTLAEGTSYRYIDLFSLVSDGKDRLVEGYTYDGLHLNADGYAIWTAAVKPYLQ
ncbi:MAG: SGNH hydrolase [Clostridia bacterium]|nr:SGNH hydrolase [Clostridia bacterium]